MTATAPRRPTDVQREASAGCFECGPVRGRWNGPNAPAQAARHHDATGHRTWANVYMNVRYGAPLAVRDLQHDIEDAIAAATGAASSSGGEPDAAPLTDFDAPAAGTAVVSAPEGRSVETRRQMPRDARGRKPEMIDARA